MKFCCFVCVYVCVSVSCYTFGHDNLGVLSKDIYIVTIIWTFCFVSPIHQINQNVYTFFLDWNTSGKVMWVDIMCDKSSEDTFMTW